MYIVNSTELIPALQKQWHTASFAALSAGAGHIVGFSSEGNELLQRDLTSEHGFTNTWPKYIMSAMGPERRWIQSTESRLRFSLRTWIT
jgi:hypothetical protein